MTTSLDRGVLFLLLGIAIGALAFARCRVHSDDALARPVPASVSDDNAPAGLHEVGRERTGGVFDGNGVTRKSA